MRETTGASRRIDNQQVVARVQVEVNVSIYRPHAMTVRVIANGGDHFIRLHRPDRAHHPIGGALRHVWSAAGLSTYYGIPPVVSLFQIARKPPKPPADVALTVQLEKLLELQRRPLKPDI